jgi:hypothetical protein
LSDVTKLGTFYTRYDSEAGAWLNQCSASYPTAPTSWGWGQYANPAGVGTDIFVMGGAINNQGSKNVSETLPSDTLLSTLFDQPADGQSSATENLNAPYGLVFGTFTLPNRPGPTQGTYDGISQCYKPGCSDQTYESTPTHSSCIAP